MRQDSNLDLDELTIGTPVSPFDSVLQTLNIVQIVIKDALRSWKIL